MSSQFRISFTVNDPAATVKNKLNFAAASGSVPPIKSLTDLRNYIDQMISGVTSAKLYVATTAVAASVTGTFTGAPTNNDTSVINGVTFTAVTSNPGANQFALGSTAAQAAANFAAAINASTSAKIRGQISASSDSNGNITLTAIVPGTSGNLFTVTDSLANFTWAAGATAFSGGTEDAPFIISHGL